MPSESDLHRWLRETQARDPRVVVPIGDDLAALRLDADDLLLVGVDQVLQDVHFRLDEHTPEQIGAKAVLRNLSDCAAMACLPAGAVVSIALPRGSGIELARQIIAGARDAGARFDCPVVGGDTGSWRGPLAVTVAIVGRSAGVTPIMRSGAKPGDRLYVTGSLGGSILGRHMTIAPRLPLARELAQRCAIHAMLDLSDGLSRDLPRLCEASGVGATIDADAVPIHPNVHELTDDLPPIEHALHDGEDHELLFASPACDDPRAIEIGAIDPQRGVRLRMNGSTTDLHPGGWEHAL